MECANRPADVDRCPTRPEIRDQILASLPRGRAWGENGDARDPNSTLYRFWDAVAAVFEDLNRAICDLRDEFFCATQSQTNAEWLADYGLPDACDPFPDLCAKVAALGGSTCDYYAAAAERAGWHIQCAAISDCGGDMGAIAMGCDFVGLGAPGATLIVDVDLGTSPAYVAANDDEAMIGCFAMGRPLGCGPDISPLLCLLERIIPAHVILVPRIIPPPEYWMVDDFTHFQTGDALVLVS